MIKGENIIQALFLGEVGSNTRNFLRNLRYVAVGSGMSTILVFLFNILGGRILGPDVYGEFALIFSVASFLGLPMAIGLGIGIMKFIPSARNEEEKKKVFSYALTGMIMSSATTMALLILFQNQIQATFHIHDRAFFLAILFAFVYTLYTFSLAGLRAFQRFFAVAGSKLLFGMVTLVGFGFFLTVRGFNWENPMILAMTSACIVTVFAIFGFFLRKHLAHVSLQEVIHSPLISYGLLAVLSGVGLSFFVMFDKMLLNKYFDPEAVGLYQAYWLASLQIVTVVFGIFNSVFFPMISAISNKRALFKKMMRVCPVLFFIGIPSLFFIQFIAISFFGNDYAFHPLWAILLAFVGILFFIYEALIWVIGSVGIEGMKKSIVLSFLFGLLTLGLDIILIPFYGPLGAILASLILFTLLIPITIIIGKKYFYGDNACY